MTKRLYTLLALLCIVWGAKAYDFVCGPLYYDILSADEATCRIVAPPSTQGAYSGQIVIPSQCEAIINGTYRQFTVTSIGEGAFKGARGLHSVTIPKTITNILTDAFADCNDLQSVIVEDSDMPLSFGHAKSRWAIDQEYAIPVFSGCPIRDLYIGRDLSQWKSIASRDHLKRVTIGDRVTEIGDFAFDQCRKLNSLSIGSNVEKIGIASFRSCGAIISISLPSSLKSVGEDAFCGCTNLKSVILPASVEALGNNVFYECSSLQTAVLPERLMVLPSQTFYLCERLTSVTLPKNLERIESSSFAYCTSLTDVTIPGRVKIISPYSFKGCGSVKSVTFGQDVEEIGQGAFDGCPQISIINVLARFIPSINTASFDSATYASARLNVGVGLARKYAEAPIWKKFENIGEAIFSDKWNGQLTINIPQNINGAYANCHLTLTNQLTGATQSITLDQRQAYVLRGLELDVAYNAELRTPAGSLLGKRIDISVGKDTETEITDCKPLFSVTATVKDADGRALDGHSIKWCDSYGNIISTQPEIGMRTTGDSISLAIGLNEEQSFMYRQPQPIAKTITETDKEIIVELDGIKSCAVTGTLIDSISSAPCSGISVTILQEINGYRKTSACVTDESGRFKMDVAGLEGHLKISDSRFMPVDKYVAIDDNIDLGPLKLQTFKGLRIGLDITYHACDGRSQSLPAQADLSFSLKDSEGNPVAFAYVYPSILVYDHVNPEKDLTLTIADSKNAFATATVHFMPKKDMTIKTEVYQRGGIDLSVGKHTTDRGLAILYGPDGRQAAYREFAVTDTLSFRDLKAGEYSLAIFDINDYVKSAYTISDLDKMGLSAHRDYGLSISDVRDGKITRSTIDYVPEFPAMDWFLDSDRTSLSTNKSALEVGNLLTLSIKAALKQEYAKNASNIRIRLSLPEMVELADNSVIRGKTPAAYTSDANEVMIFLPDLADRIQLCLLPYLTGKVNIGASLAFVIENKEWEIPLGIVQFNVKGLSIQIPGQISKKRFDVSGTAPRGSKVDVMDGNTLIGSAVTGTGGLWKTSCQVADTTMYSWHKIYAKCTTPDGHTVKTETKDVQLKKHIVRVSKVTMYNTAHYGSDITAIYENKVVFDFLNPNNSPGGYRYWTQYPIFTFQIDFVNNDPALIDNVWLTVTTTSGEKVKTPAKFDYGKYSWIATAKFPSTSSQPIRVAVSYNEIDDIEDPDAYIANFCKYMGSEVEVTILEDSDTTTLAEIKSPFGNSLLRGIRVVSGRTKHIDRLKKHLKARKYEEVETIEVSEDLSVKIFTNAATGHTATVKVNSDSTATYQIPTDDKEESERLKDDADNDFATDPPAIEDNPSTPPSYTDDDEEDIYPTKQPNDNKGSRDKICETDLDADGYPIFKHIQNRPRDLLNRTLGRGCDGVTLSLLLMADRKLDCGGFRTDDEIYALQDAAHHLRNMTVYTGATIIANSIQFVRDAADRPNFGENVLVNMYNTYNYANTLLEDAQRLDDAVRTMSRNARFYANIIRDMPECPDQCKDTQTTDSLSATASPSWDPAGFVYEGVESNRVQGVKATCYYSRDPNSEENQPVLWDAQEYGQYNPLFTDRDGSYAWDVPQGMWQVKFEKEGYETAYSEWLPVPPPQLEVNVGIKRFTSPVVSKTALAENGIFVEFDKYMNLDLCSGSVISVYDPQNNLIPSHIKAINTDHDVDGNSFASKFSVEFDKTLVPNKVFIRIDKAAKSYAGTQMTEDYTATFDISSIITSIEATPEISINPGDEYNLTVKALPASAAAGRQICIKASTLRVLSLSDSILNFDSNGNAEIKVTGLMPGTSVLSISVDGYRDILFTTVNVEPHLIEVNPPTGRFSLTEDNEIALTLETSTVDAVIYYTIDGSSPDTSVSAIEYTGPFVVPMDTEVRTYAIREGMCDSQIVSFKYGSSHIDDVAPDNSNEAKVSIIAIDGQIRIEAEDIVEYAVYTVDGHLYTQGQRLGGFHISPPSGVYIVKAGAGCLFKVKKVML